MSLLGGRKQANQGKEEKYGRITLSAPSNDKVKFEKLILNLDSELAKQIEQYINREKENGRRMRDHKTGRLKKINKSLWARDVFQKALLEEGFIKED